MNERTEHLRLDQLTFGDYWPPGTPDMVRAFLKRKVENGETFPGLRIAEVDGDYHVIGWKNKPDEPGLLEAARGWALTDSEEAWVRFITGGGAELEVAERDAQFIAVIAEAERLGLVEAVDDGLFHGKQVRVLLTDEGRKALFGDEEPPAEITLADMVDLMRAELRRRDQEVD